MITDEVVEACETMIEQCQDNKMKMAMEMMLNMLMDFTEDEWLDMTPRKQRAWVCEYLGE